MQTMASTAPLAASLTAVHRSATAPGREGTRRGGARDGVGRDLRLVQPLQGPLQQGLGDRLVEPAHDHADAEVAAVVLTLEAPHVSRPSRRWPRRSRLVRRWA